MFPLEFVCWNVAGGLSDLLVIGKVLEGFRLEIRQKVSIISGLNNGIIFVILLWTFIPFILP